ncbi:GDP-D-glucose phosphorylase 1-like isoform X2 [Lineus longissimus]
MESGHFKYNLNGVESRVVPGDKRYIVELNEKRFAERRKPQQIDHICQPFNPTNFNFNKIKPDEILFQMKREQDDAKTPQNLVVINVSPLGYGHVLLVTDVESCTNQVLTEDAIRFGIETMLLSSSPAFRVAFNSLRAFASVNHLHLHAWYLHQSQIIETMDATELGNGCFELTESLVHGFAFQLAGQDIANLCKKIHRITSYFIDNNFAHNMSLTRGRAFDDHNKQTVRIFLWPRQSVSVPSKADNPFNVAAAELSGHLPIRDRENFKSITEEVIDRALENECLPHDVFNKIKEDVMSLMKV